MYMSSNIFSNQTASNQNTTSGTPSSGSPMISSPFDVSGGTQTDNSPPKRLSTTRLMVLLLLVPILGAIGFAVGSWQLSLLIDQAKCHHRDMHCLLPGNPNALPYKGPRQKAKSSAMAAARAAKTSIIDKIKLTALRDIAGVTPRKKRKGGMAATHPLPAASGPRIQKGGNKGIDHILTSINIHGFRPFDIFNGPAQFPYDLAYEKSSWWEVINFQEWFGNMQITAWSTARMILSGYLSTFGAMISTNDKQINYWSRLFMTLLMPLILGLAIFLAPLVSFGSSIWGMFKGGHNYFLSLLFLFFPCFTVMTMILQMLQLFTYILIGGLLGSGHAQMVQNFLEYSGIIQFILAVILLIGLVIFIVGVAKSDSSNTTSTSSQNGSVSSSNGSALSPPS